MKKFYLIAALAVATLATKAQERLFLSTNNGTNIEKYDGKVCRVTMNRMVFNGWNTIALPFYMSETELNEVFGNDCRLEQLVGAEADNGSIILNFQDCKSEGLQANTPYILHYTGETANKKIVKEATISNAQPAQTFSVKGSGETLTIAGLQTKTSGTGLYGILAIDNGDAKFVSIEDETKNFLATRCYIKLTSGSKPQLITRHLAAGQVSSIESIASQNELIDVFNTSGVKVASQIKASEITKLQPNIYIVKGQKIIVR